LISVQRYEAALDPWMSSLWSMLNQINHKFFTQGTDFVIPDMKLIDQPKVQITYHCNDKVDPQFHPNSGNLVGRVLFIMNAQ